MSAELEDPVEKSIGRFGRYHIWIWILLSIGRLPTEFQLSNVVFLLPAVDFVCADIDVHYENATNFCPCDNPIYDNSTFTSTVTSTWDLICNRRHLASLAQSMLQVGILFGSLIYGYISDRFGRRIAVVLALSTEVLFVSISAAVPDLWMFLLLRLLIGTAVGGTMLCCYVLIIELSGKTFRPYLMGLVETSYIAGYFVLPMIAYFVRDWRHLQLVTSLPWLFVLAYYWLIPESPRWLVTVGRKKEAIVILTQIAKKNKKPIDRIEEYVNEIEQQTATANHQHGTYLDLFRTKKIRTYTILMAIVWLCCAHTFFGVNQYIGRLEGNIYLNVMLSAASLAPGMVLCVIANLYFKRKVSVISFFVTAAISLILLTFTSNEHAVLALAIIGQIGSYTAFVTVYLFTSEVFPTVVRNSAMGIASVFGRFGGFIAPFVVDIDVEWISIVIFSALAFFAAVLCCFLPETKGIVLFNTVEQIEREKDEESEINNK